MKRGVKTTPLAIKIKKGMQACRTNFKEPKLKKETDGTPPPGLDALAVAEWNRVFPELKKQGVLCKTDRQTLAGYCHAYSVWQTAVNTMNTYPPMVWTNKLGIETKMPLTFLTPNGMVQQIPAVNIAKSWGLSMLRFAVELGLTPSARSGIIGVDPSADKDGKLLAQLMGDGGDVAKTKKG